MNILILCHGNLNRSPLAEVVLKSEIKKHNISNVTVKSAGLKTTKNGSPAARKMRIICEDINYSLKNHKTTMMTQELDDWADVILVMSMGNLRRHADEFKNTQKVQLLAKYLPGNKINIPDPGFLKADDPQVKVIRDIVVEATKAYAKTLVEFVGV